MKYALLLVVACAFGTVVLSVAGCATSHTLVTPDGLTRGYNLFAPSTATPDAAPMPLVIALHQFSDTARGMEKLANFNALAEKEKFLVAYPQGRFRVWNANQLESPDDVVFIEAMIDAIADEYPVDDARIYACGASAGGMMAQLLACRSGRIAAIAPVMGSQPQDAMADCTPGRMVPTLIIHGDADPIIPYGGGETYAGPGQRPVFMSALETAEFWVENNGCTGEALEEELPPVLEDDPTRVVLLRYPCNAENEVLFYTVQGGGHTWPGQDNWYPKFIVGKTSMQLDATSVIWDFFKDKRLHE